MKRPTLNITKRPPKAPALEAPPAEVYRRRSDHLAAAGGAHLVIPWGLVDQLPDELQQQLVNVLGALHTTHPEWVDTAAYQVLPWHRIHVADLDDRELSWHGITSDIDPETSTLTYTRGNVRLAGNAVIGHRPGLESVPSPVGTTSGLRPPLLLAPPEADPVSAAQARSQPARLGRSQRLLTTRDRTARIHAHNPEISSSWADAIAATDDAWTDSSTWQRLASLDTPAPAVDPAEQKPPIPRPKKTAAGADPTENNELATPPDAAKPASKVWKPDHSPDTQPTEETPPTDAGLVVSGSATDQATDDYGLAELDAELRDLVSDDSGAR